jgi:hypothetical protein
MVYRLHPAAVVRTDHRAGDKNSHAGIWRTADNGQRLRLTNIHLANAQSVSVRMFFNIKYVTDHHMTEKRCDWLQFFNLKTSHGQGVSQLLGWNGRVTKFAQPRFRKLHEYALKKSLKLA